MQSIKGLARSARNVFGDTFDKVTSPGQRSKADEHNASFRSRTLFSPTRSCEVNTGKTVRHQTKAANFLEATRTSRKTLLLTQQKNFFRDAGCYRPEDNIAGCCWVMQ